MTVSGRRDLSLRPLGRKTNDFKNTYKKNNIQYFSENLFISMQKGTFVAILV